MPQKNLHGFDKRFCLLALFALLIGATDTNEAACQSRRLKKEGYRSPEVHADRRVTFRIKAPGAESVKLFGSLKSRPAETTNEKGLWSLTVGPLPSDIYEYAFLVDGVYTLDPVNRSLKASRKMKNMFEVRTDPPRIDMMRDVPHGSVHIHHYRSQSLKSNRRLQVYTPPGYETSEHRYPVLYLLHGSGDSESVWNSSGRAQWIVDNLLAEEKIVPMIVVMPNGHPIESNVDYAENVEAMRQDVIDEVIPLVDRMYRTHADADHRAIAGTSMGGSQSLRLGLGHPDRFHWLGIFSAPTFPDFFESHFSDLPVDSGSLNQQLRLFWIRCGDQERLTQNNVQFDVWLTEQGMEHDFALTPGDGHGWVTWRRYLPNFLPLLFRAGDIGKNR